MNIQKINSSLLANTNEEYLALLASDADWFIRSIEDINNLKVAKIEPFTKLSEVNFEKFVKSLTFSQGGLGHANYQPLMEELTLTEIFNIFSYFGLGIIKVLDYADMRCSGPSTCVSQNFSICTSSC
ncbi:hypothetical protein [Acinetobacter nosocomialis]|uniref:hypothetical protein n=1 Tax=Acinetobacter nosocomialis TaxID=106654 RepID=UPI000DE64B65|nr:hypothetical protein [Acinetobacter nosocomialis]SSV52240.1 Uncharacterised protein [Acinetobacter nosocomialis]